MSVDYVEDRRVTKKIIEEVVAGYAEFAAERVADGWHPSIVTMMFRRLSPMHGPVLAQMSREAELVYRTFVTHVVRRPLSHRSVSKLPVMILLPDASVGKSDKPLARIELNGGGLHLHGVLLVPPISRLRVTAAEHFRERQSLYVRERSLLECTGEGRERASPLERVDVDPVERTVERAVEYILKGLPRRRCTMDDVLVLPRALADMARRRHSGLPADGDPGASRRHADVFRHSARELAGKAERLRDGCDRRHALDLVATYQRAADQMAPQPPDTEHASKASARRL